MPAHIYPGRELIAVYLILTGLGVSNAAEPNKASDKLFQYIKPDYESSGISALADALGFQNWPQTNVWRVAPDVNEFILTYPEKTPRENIGYYAAQLGNDYWGNCSIMSGSLKLKISNTPNSRFAYEILLNQMSNTQMPMEAVISNYLHAEKLSDLGTISFVRKNRSGNPETVEFIRDNIFVFIRMYDASSDAALRLARKIDSAIVKGPALTYKQLIGRRPTLTISSEIKKDKIDNWKSISYDIRTPNEVNVVDVKATIWDERHQIKDGKIIIGKEFWPLDIKLTAITSELLVGQCEKTIEIPDENKKTDQTEPNRAMSKLFDVLTVSPNLETSDSHEIAEALGFQNWPQTKVWRVAPDVNKSMLIHPEKATKEGESYQLIQFGQDLWGSHKWSIYCLVENNEPLPTELPEEMKSALLHPPPEIRNNPDRIKKYSEELLESYREMQKYRSIGLLDVEICNTPNSRAANEYLLKRQITSAIPAENVISRYSHANKLTDLGTISYVTASYVDFIRDNIFVTIRGNGELADEVLQLAKKIDSAILKSPELTYEQLISRRPSFTAPEDIQFQNVGRAISYDYIVPAGAKVVDASSTVNGRNYGFIKNRIIILPQTNGNVDIKLTATTNELLVGQCEKTVEIPESNRAVIH